MGFSTAIRNASLNAITTAAGNGALLTLYSGTRPATGAALSGNTLLGTLTCGSPLAPAAANGTLTFSTITEDSAADASGTCTWARLTTSGGTFLIDFSVTATGGGGDITMNSVAISAGLAIQAISATIADGNP
jgi:hypothetical protein